MVDNTIVNAFVNALKDKFENKVANKKTDISGDFSTDTVSYPTVQAVKNWVSSQLSNIGNLVLGETSSTAYRGDRGKTAYDHSQTTTGNPHNVTKNDVGLGNVTNVAQAPATHVGDNTHLTSAQKTTIDAVADKANTADLADVATSGSYADLTDKPTLTSLGGDVTVEQQATAESGFAATYVVKQNGVQVGPKINILKDNFFESVTKKTVGATPTQLETANNLVTGDVYLEFVVTTNDQSSSNKLLLNMNDFLDNVSYTAGNGLTLSGNQFSIQNGAIVISMLESSVQTSLGYANNWNSSAAKNITSANITSWNNKSNLTISDVDSEIEAYLDAITTALA